MKVQLVELIDEDLGETFVFSSVGQFNENTEIRRLKKLVKEFPNTYEKLGNLITRNSYIFKVPNRLDKNYRYKSIMLAQNVLTEEILQTQRSMLDGNISKIISDQDYECINPIQECISAIETRAKEVWTPGLNFYYNKYSKLDSVTETSTSKNRWNKYMRSYYTKHAQKIIDQKKEYYQKRKELLNEKVDCECTGRYTKQNFSTHEKTKKHQLFVNRSV